jgi:HK97 family phage major capsid protein
MQKRFIGVNRADAQAVDGDLVVDLAFASTEPYERWWGTEILDTSEKAVRTGRLNDGAPVLFNHDWNELRGVHVPGTIRHGDDGVLRGKVRLTSATQAGRETIALVESGVLTKASIGYTIHKIIEKSKAKDGKQLSREIDGAYFEGAVNRAMAKSGPAKRSFLATLDLDLGRFDRGDDEESTFVVVDWEPHENSLVTVPADPTVGIGRSNDQQAAIAAVSPTADTATKGAKMADAVQAAAGTAEVVGSAPQKDVATMERERKEAIINLCRGAQLDEMYAQRWITSGADWGTISKEFLTIREERSRKDSKNIEVGLSDAEIRKFSITRAMNAVVNKNWNMAGLEAEASKTIAQRMGKVPNEHTFYVPLEIQRRDLIVGTSTMGGYLVSTGNQGFIDLLRNNSVVMSMGANRLSGLQGSVTIPKQTAPGTGYWLATEATAATESQLVIGQLALTPRNVGAYTEISRQLLLQSSPDAEQLVMSDLAAVIGLTVDQKALYGTGSEQPTGITAVSGIGSVTITTGDVVYANVLEFQSDAMGGNALSDMSGYVTTPAIAGFLKSKQKFASTDTPLWRGRLNEGRVDDDYRAMSSNQMTAGHLLFGDFNQVVIAEWGVLEVEVNPYANFAAGIVGVRAFYTCDVGLRYPAAFSLGTGITK